MKLTLKKVIATNIILIIIILCAKIWNYYYLARMGKIFSNNGGGKISADFITLYLHQSEDVLIGIPDFTIYIIVIGLLINLFFLSYIRKERN